MFKKNQLKIIENIFTETVTDLFDIRLTDLTARSVTWQGACICSLHMLLRVHINQPGMNTLNQS